MDLVLCTSVDVFYICFKFCENISKGLARCYLWFFMLYINIKIGKNSC